MEWHRSLFLAPKQDLSCKLKYRPNTGHTDLYTLQFDFSVYVFFLSIVFRTDQFTVLPLVIQNDFSLQIQVYTRFSCALVVVVVLPFLLFQGRYEGVLISQLKYMIERVWKSVI